MEKQAKAHLEEELRAELEEKEHIIVTLNTKVVLLKEVTKGVSNGDSGEVISEKQQLVDVSADSGTFPLEERKEEQGEGRQEQGLVEGRQPHMEEKVRRLESLLSKCKENIKANKQKTVALTEVKPVLYAWLSNLCLEYEGVFTLKFNLAGERAAGPGPGCQGAGAGGGEDQGVQGGARAAGTEGQGGRRGAADG